MLISTISVKRAFLCLELFEHSSFRELRFFVLMAFILLIFCYNIYCFSIAV